MDEQIFFRKIVVYKVQILRASFGVQILIKNLLRLLNSVVDFSVFCGFCPWIYFQATIQLHMIRAFTWRFLTTTSGHSNRSR